MADPFNIVLCVMHVSDLFECHAAPVGLGAYLGGGAMGGARAREALRFDKHARMCDVPN